MMFKTPLINMLFPFENGDEENKDEAINISCCLCCHCHCSFICMCDSTATMTRRKMCAFKLYINRSDFNARWVRTHRDMPVFSSVECDTCFKRANRTNTQIIQSIPAFESKQNAMIVVVVAFVDNVFNVFVVFVVFLWWKFILRNEINRNISKKKIKLNVHGRVG